MNLTSIKGVTFFESIEHSEYKDLTSFFTTKSVDYNNKPLHDTIIKDSIYSEKVQEKYIIFNDKKYNIPLGRFRIKRLTKENKIDEINKLIEDEKNIISGERTDDVYTPGEFRVENSIIFYFISNKKIISYINAKYDNDNDIIFIDHVEVHPDHYRKGLCTLSIKTLVKYVREYLEIDPVYKLYSGAGCKCYFRGFSEYDFKVYDWNKNKFTECPKDDGGGEMMFIPPEKQTGGYLYYRNKYQQNKTKYLSMVK
jgi:hypothetical protein